MQTMTQKLSSLKIAIDKIHYNTNSKTLTIEILNFSYVGLYKKSTKLKTILNDIAECLKDTGLNREKISVVAFGNKSISENKKIKELMEFKKEIIPEVPIIPKTEKPQAPPSKKKIRSDTKKDSAIFYDAEELKEEVKIRNREEALPSAPGAPPKGDSLAGGSGSLSQDLAKTLRRDEERLSDDFDEEKIVYDVNMGFQYYSVMMEKKSYLFYVFLSHEELKIMDEEGKVIYTTTVHIETTKKEPPVLNIIIQGEGFETHPLNGRVVVHKDAVNPPVMIFSVMPLKMEKGKKQKDPQRRFLNVMVEYEENVISKTILGIIVQPKYFHLDLGPIQLYLSKRSAFIISLFSVLIASASFIYTIITYGSGPGFTEFLGGFIPGLASVIFFGFYVITLIRGFHPLKQKWNNLLNFDKITPLIK
jgi:hypothetical protein